jgi:hypothetical protein
LNQDVLFGLQPTDALRGVNRSADNDGIPVGSAVAEIRLTTPDFGSASNDVFFIATIYLSLSHLTHS